MVCVCGDSVRDDRDRFQPTSMFAEDSMTAGSNFHLELRDCCCQHYLKGARMDPVRLLADNLCCIRMMNTHYNDANHNYKLYRSYRFLR